MRRWQNFHNAILKLKTIRVFIANHGIGIKGERSLAGEVPLDIGQNVEGRRRSQSEKRDPAPVLAPARFDVPEKIEASGISVGRCAG